MVNEVLNQRANSVLRSCSTRHCVRMRTSGKRKTTTVDANRESYAMNVEVMLHSLQACTHTATRSPACLLNALISSPTRSTPHQTRSRTSRTTGCAVA
jgi:hypothetical protein